MCRCRVDLRALAILLVPAAVWGDAPGPDPAGRLVAGERLFRPPIEWSSWVRGAWIAAESADEPATATRTIAPPRMAAERTRGEAAIGLDASLPLSIGGSVRLGAWSELRGFETHDLFAGGELVLTAVPRRFDAFLYEGSGILALRAGRSTDRETAAIAFGYLAPWKLEGPCEVRFFDIPTGVCEPRPARATRYMVGVRAVVTATRAVDDARDWSISIGIETELFGALRTLGLRSWY